MREIKFRAWDGKRYTTDFFITSEGTVFKPHYDRDAEIVSGFTIEQLTGLHDKNGKEIYEGDLIAGGLLSEPCRVMHQETCGRFIAFGTHYKVLAHKFEQFEVIGNIHENPELLND